MNKPAKEPAKNVLQPGQDQPDLPPDEDQNNLDAFWLNRDRARGAAAAQVVGIRDPIGTLALRVRGEQLVIWDEVGFRGLLAPELSPKLLRLVRDNRWPPDLVGKPLKEVHPADRAFYQLYTQAMLYAFDVPLDAFQNSAEETGDVTWADLMETRDLHNEKFRGKVIRVKGRLGQLRSERLVGAVAEKGGPQQGYIGWVFGPTRKAPPFRVEFPNLPRGLKPAEHMNQPVTFYGYFLATTKYEGAPVNGKPNVLTTPFLVGPTLVLEEAPPTAATPALPVILVALTVAGSFIAFLTILFFVMYFWFARSDRNVIDTLAMIKQKHAEFPFGESEANADGTNGTPFAVPPGGPVGAAPIGTVDNPASSQLVAGAESTESIPEAKPIVPLATPPIDPKRN